MGYLHVAQTEMQSLQIKHALPCNLSGSFPSVRPVPVRPIIRRYIYSTSLGLSRRGPLTEAQCHF